MFTCKASSWIVLIGQEPIRSIRSISQLERLILLIMSTEIEEVESQDQLRTRHDREDSKVCTKTSVGLITFTWACRNTLFYYSQSNLIIKWNMTCDKQWFLYVCVYNCYTYYILCARVLLLRSGI